MSVTWTLTATAIGHSVVTSDAYALITYPLFPHSTHRYATETTSVVFLSIRALLTPTTDQIVAIYAYTAHLNEVVPLIG